MQRTNHCLAGCLRYNANHMANSFSAGRSYLLVQPTPLVGTEYSEVLASDLLLADAFELTVKDLRGLLAATAQRPYGQFRLFIINNAQELSPILQNILLKTLEEPSSQLVIILHATAPDGFLPTVRSRLHHLTSTNTATATAEPVFTSSETAAAAQLAATKDRATLKELLRRELAYQMTQVSQEVVAPTRVGLLERAILKLERNCNQKLVADWLLLHWFEYSGN